jgi:hypothetical protein
MPQITVTIDDETYMNLTHFLPKGLKSKFVNMAVAQAMFDCSIPKGNIYGLPSRVLGNVVHRYARDGPDDAVDLLMSEMQRLEARRQAFPEEFRGDEEE